MRFSTVVYAAALGSVALAQNNGGNNNNNGGNNNNNNGGNGGNNDLALNPDLVQIGSTNPGGNNGVANDGQALSATSNNNFINFCEGKTLTNGAQIEGGSCNGVGKSIAYFAFDLGC
jgi:transcription initiation factor TFIID subunit 15